MNDLVLFSIHPIFFFEIILKGVIFLKILIFEFCLDSFGF